MNHLPTTSLPPPALRQRGAGHLNCAVGRAPSIGWMARSRTLAAFGPGGGPMPTLSIIWGFASVERQARGLQIGGSLVALCLLGFAIGLTRRLTARRVAAEAALAQARASVAASEEHFRQVFDFAGIGMAIVGLDGRWLRVNKSVTNLTGYTSSELLGLTFQELASEPDPSAPDELSRELLAGAQRFYQAEKKFVHRKGHPVWVRLSASVVRDIAGQPLHFLVQLEDISLARQNEAARRASEDTFERLFDLSPDAVFLVDGEGIISRANWRAVEVFGWDRPALAGRPFADLLTTGSGSAQGAELADFFRAPKEAPIGAGRAWHGRRQHGGEFPLEMSLSALPRGESSRTLVIARDITPRMELEATLARARDEAVAASRMKSDFLAHLGEEIRTLMNAIVAMTDLLRDTPLSPDQGRRVASTQAGAARLLRTIDTLLDYSRLEAGKLRLSEEAFDARELIQSIVAQLAPRAQAKLLAIGVAIRPDEPVWVRGDAGRLRQVLAHLLGNAIKFTDRGSVTLSADHRGVEADRIRLRIGVRDTGIGLGENARAWLFQPFSRAETAATLGGAGAGLGLALSKHLVESMGGTLELESTPGQGSVFWFVLHLPAAAAAPSTRELPQAGAGPRQLRLLLVEDNLPSQTVALGMLSKLGHQIDVAENGRAALSRLASAPYDAVLMDCQMPEMDGFEATRLIRAGQVEGLDRSIPIIGVTAYALATDHERCRAAGMNEVLSKPVRSTDLAAVLVRLRLGSESVPAMD